MGNGFFCPLYYLLDVVHTAILDFMNDGSTTSIDALRIRVDSLIENSERLFLGFGEIFPPFVKELKKSIEDSRSSLASLGAGQSIDEAIQNIFIKTRRTIKLASSDFSEMHKRDDILLESLNRAIITLEQLDSVITKIREDSESMELISLNAMTVALKSGHAGKAFSVITDELKRLSTRTIQVTDKLINDGHVLLKHFTGYRTDVEKLEETQTTLFNGLEERVQGSFGSLEASLEKIAVTLKSMVEQSSGLEKPVQTIMETVQLQDILRQSLDHVIMALNEIDKTDQADYDDPAEYLLFSIQLLSLSQTILTDVKAHLEKARFQFKEGSSAIHTVITKGEKGRRQLIEQFFSTSAVTPLGEDFKTSAAMLQEIKNQVESYVSLKYSISKNGERLSETVQGLEKGFKSFDKIINRFRTIDIASRIEISKQFVLRSINETVKEMTKLIDRISSDVSSALTITQGFISEIRGAIQVYTSTLKDEKHLVLDADQNLSESHGSLVALGESIRAGVQGFTLFSDTFLELLNSGTREMQGLDTIIRDCESMNAELQRLKEEAEDKLNSCGKTREEADLHSQRLKDIIGRFTIYAHKQAAAEIGGFKVDSEGLDIIDQIESDTITFF